MEFFKNNKLSQDSVREAFKVMREDIKYKDSHEYLNPGMALDRTIPRLDRVGYFLLGDNNELSVEAPAWLWEIVENIWKWFPSWQECRKSEHGEEFLDKHDGRYFKRLHIYYKKNEENLKNWYSESDDSLQDC
jgi:hypothetical protein